MKKWIIFSNVATAVTVALVSQDAFPASHKIPCAVILFGLTMLVLESSRDAIVEIKEEWGEDYGRKRSKAR